MSEMTCGQCTYYAEQKRVIFRNRPICMYYHEGKTKHKAYVRPFLPACKCFEPREGQQ